MPFATARCYPVCTVAQRPGPSRVVGNGNELRECGVRSRESGRSARRTESRVESDISCVACPEAYSEACSEACSRAAAPSWGWASRARPPRRACRAAAGCCLCPVPSRHETKARYVDASPTTGLCSVLRGPTLWERVKNKKAAHIRDRADVHVCTRDDATTRQPSRQADTRHRHRGTLHLIAHAL